jgi:hypothetical protein
MLYPDGIFCPKCEKVTKPYRIKARPAYSCQFCGHLEHPMKGKIFEGSSTSLKLWFHGMYVMASTRCGISPDRGSPMRRPSAGTSTLAASGSSAWRSPNSRYSAPAWIFEGQADEVANCWPEFLNNSEAPRSTLFHAFRVAGPAMSH